MKKFRLFPLILLLCMAFTLLAPCAFAVDDPDIGAQRAVIATLTPDAYSIPRIWTRRHPPRA